MASPPQGGDQRLDAALRDLAFAVKALQLYPNTSPVVRDAVGRAHETIQPLLQRAPLHLDVLPDQLRIGSEELPRGGALEQLADRLHRRGVSHVHLDADLAPVSLQRLAELLATDPQTLSARGGITALQQDDRMPGITLDLLRLDRLFEEEDGAPDPDDPWQSLLGGYGEEEAIEEIDWEYLASRPEQLERFMRWLLQEDGAAGYELSEISQLELVRTICRNVGGAAAAIGDDQVELVASVVAGFYDDLDKEVWLNLLTRPVEPTASPDEETLDAAREASVDLGRRLAGALSRQQVEELVVYGLETRRDSSPRIFQLLDNVLERRSDRESIAQAIRETVARNVGDTAGGGKFEDLWPRLSDALQGEDPEPYVSDSYRVSLDELLLSEAPASLWPLEELAPRMRELTPTYVLQRKSRVLLEILEREKDDAEYEAVALELERSLPEFITQGQYLTTEEILGVFARHLAPSAGRSVGQRQTARDILLHFCNQHTLREVVRNLAGKPRTQIDAATRIFQSLGPMAVPALLEALSQESSRSVRLHLVRMLSAMGDRALPEIQKHLRDQRWFFVRNLVWIIGEIGDTEFARHLGIAVDHGDVRVRREAVRALAKLGTEDAVDGLLGALEDDDEEVRLLAIRGLGHSGSKRTVAPLCELVRMRNWDGRNTAMIRAAAIALGRIADPRAEAPLRKTAATPWLFKARRAPATAAAKWALEALRGEATGEAPEDAALVEKAEAPTGLEADGSPALDAEEEEAGLPDPARADDDRTSMTT